MPCYYLFSRVGVLKAEITQHHTLLWVTKLLSGTQEMVIRDYSRGAPWGGVGVRSSVQDFELIPARAGFDSRWWHSWPFLLSFLIFDFTEGLTFWEEWWSERGVAPDLEFWSTAFLEGPLKSSVGTLSWVRRVLVEPPGASPFAIRTEFPSHEHFYECNQSSNEKKLCAAEYAQDKCSNHGENLKSWHLILIEHLSLP